MKLLKKNRFSIESRLLFFLTPPLVIICIATIIIAPKIITKITYNVFDKSLYSVALQLEDQLYFKQDAVSMDLHYFNFIFPESKVNDSIFYKITDHKGNMVIGFEDLITPDMPGFSHKRYFFDSRYKGEKIRGVVYRTRLNSPDLKGFIEIIVAETTNERESILYKAIYTILGLILLVSIFTITISIVGIRKGIKPLKRLRQKISKRSIDNLKQITIDVPLEVESLVLSINSLIRRVKDSLSHIQYFNADVSHQLRTPLAEMSALIEITEKENDIQSIKNNLHQMQKLNYYMSHMVQQLLMYAKVQANSADLSKFKKIDIVELIKEQCALVAPGIYKNNQTISFHKADGPFFIKGDDILLQGMFLNIIDNSKKYAVDTRGIPTGEIQVAVLKDEDKGFCKLRICDQGPGIGEKFIDKAFERFERRRKDMTQEGLGFGLAIVKEVILIHSGTVHLENRSPNGLCLIIKLPLS